MMKKCLGKLMFSILGLLTMIIPVKAYAAGSVASVEGDYGIRDYSIAFGENGSVSYENHGDGTDENSVFELGSNGKTIAAYVALKLAEEGKTDLDDHIAPYLDRNLITDDERLKDITLRQLLCHTAGFSPSFELGVDKKIYSDPGEEFRYSGVGYIYLQNVIENVSGMNMEQAAKHYVFDPLGMSSSTFSACKTVTPYIRLSSAVLYAFAGFVLAFAVLFLIMFVAGKLTKFRFFSLKNGYIICFVLAGVLNSLFMMFVLVSKVAVVFWGFFVIAGVSLWCFRKRKALFYSCVPVMTVLILLLGSVIPCSVPVTNDIVPREANCAYTLRSTSKDMAVFCQELMRQYNNKDGAVKEMFSPAVKIDDTNSWGLGIAIESENTGETYWHSGINPGFQSLYVLYPAQDKYIVVVTNSDDGLEFSQNVSRSFLGVDGFWDIKR